MPKNKSQTTDFSSERQMRDYFVKNLDLLEPGLVSVKSPTGTAEFSCCVEGMVSKGGSIDILAKDRRSNLVVIECKVKTARADALGQALGYIAWINRHLSVLGPVRAFIVARHVSPLLIWATSLVPNIPVSIFECPRPGELRRLL